MDSHARLYLTLCRVLDALSAEAPPSAATYYPPAGNQEALIQARSRALIHLFLKAKYGRISFKDREYQTTDGPQDGGIDAFHIDQANKVICVLQSKFRASAGNMVASNMSTDDLLKMDVARILKGEKKDDKGIKYNDGILRLQREIQKLPDAGSYTTKVILLGNAKRFTASQKKKLVDGYHVDQYDHERLYQELLFPIVNGTFFADPNLTIQINLANLKGDSHLDYDVKAQGQRANIKLLFVPTREVGQIMSKYKNSILKFNPRSFLELQTNTVNQQIEASIRDGEGNEFALFNNGITIISDRTSISSDTAKQGAAQIVLRNPQLVNGGQTAYTLSRVFETCQSLNDYSPFKGKEVLLRVITFVDPGKPATAATRLQLIGDVSKASNSQTKIDESDRRSNDEIQVQLQSEFFTKYGLYYERKRGEFADGLRAHYIDGALLVNRERLLRISLAIDFKINLARSSVSKFFHEDALASQLSVKKTASYAFGYEIYSCLEKKRREKPLSKGDRYHTKQYGQALRYGQYAVTAVCSKHSAGKKSAMEVASSVLDQWPTFEDWIQKQPSNKAYRDGTAFDFVNYYKGATINSDVQSFKFK